MADKLVVLDSHAYNDTRIMKHISSVGDDYPVFRLNFNFFHERMLAPPDEIGARVVNASWSGHPYLNGMIFLIKNAFGYSRGIARFLRKDFLNNDDRLIFHVHDPYLLGLAKKLKRRFPDSRIVYDRHEYYEIWHNRLGFSFQGALEKLYGDNVDEIVFVSSRLDSLPTCLGGKKVSVIPNYPEGRRFPLDLVDDKIEGLDNSERLEFVYFGVLNLGFDRDMRLMFRLMDSLMASRPNVDFTVAGRIDHKDVRPYLDELATKYGERMRYLGEITYEEVVTRTRNAHLGFFLLRTDIDMWSDDRPVSPNKIYEYLLSGTIPIVKAVLDDLEAIRPCALIFGKESTYEEIRDAIEDLLDDKDRMKRMMAECAKLGRTFTWEAVSPLYLECYDRLFDSMSRGTNQ